MDLNPIIVTFWGQNQEKLQLLEKHLSENGIKQWSYYFGFPGQGLKLRISEKEIYYADPNVLRNKYVGQNLTHYGLWAALKMMAERDPKETQWTIMEDDCELVENWTEPFGEEIATLKRVSENLYRGAGLCLHWYMLRRKALDILLETNKFIRARMDVQMLKDSYPHLKTYTVLPSLAGQRDTVLQK
jgi:hypothetical protein